MIYGLCPRPLGANKHAARSGAEFIESYFGLYNGKAYLEELLEKALEQLRRTCWSPPLPLPELCARRG
ncbi:MAG: hypothetical protein U0514_00665 [Candidatus Andersenbacteria bacterium]